MEKNRFYNCNSHFYSLRDFENIKTLDELFCRVLDVICHMSNLFK